MSPWRVRLGGKQKWNTIARTDHMTIADARIELAEIVGRIKQGLTPTEAEAGHAGCCR